MNKINIPVINDSINELPQYETTGAAGLDVRANLTNFPEKFAVDCKWENNSLYIMPGGRALIPSGLHVAIPEGYEIQVRPRSGLALKKGITCLNTPGTIDADYRGDIGVILINHGKEAFKVEQGDRIAQLVLKKVEIINWIPVESLESTERGEGGFNSTGVK